VLDALRQKQSYNIEIEGATTVKRAVKIPKMGILISTLALFVSLIFGIMIAS
jgi:hypothetical protein